MPIECEVLLGTEGLQQFGRNAIGGIQLRRGITGNDNSGTSYGVSLAGTAPFVDLTPDAEGNFPDNPFNASNPLQTAALSRVGETTNRFISSGRFAFVSVTRSTWRTASQ